MSPKSAAAVALGRKGGEATAKKLTKEERKSSARRAAEARWAKTMKRIDTSLKRSAKIGKQTDVDLKELKENIGKLERKSQAALRRVQRRGAKVIHWTCPKCGFQLHTRTRR